MNSDSHSRLKSNARRIIVIGAGPAGSFAAISAARSGGQVTVLERQAASGLKLLATGGGRCNLTNTLSTRAFIERFGPAGRFMTHALQKLSSLKLLELFQSWGVSCEASDGFHYFPSSQLASDILSAIMRQMADMNVEVRYGVSVENIFSEDDSIVVSIKGGRDLRADAVILATGGAGYAALGGNFSGYMLAEKMGHTVIKPVPGLTGLRTRELWPGECAGITIPDVQVKIDERGFKGRTGYGDLLFTHRGVSGPPVIDVSGSVSRLLLTQSSVKLGLKFCKDYQTAKALRDLFSTWRQSEGKRLVHNVAATLVPKRLAATLCSECGIPGDMLMARLPGKAEERLLSIFNNTTLNVTGSEGFAHAMVTAGGISLKEVDPSTLSSKVMSGIYFAGEILDLDGPCGGFNLQWAMSSGWLAGNAACGPW